MADTTAPRVTSFPVPAFSSPTTNPYGLGDVGDFASPSLVDIDGDGDLDAFIGTKDGNTLVFINTGTASSPAFAAASTNPYGLNDVGLNARPDLVDIDGDGDLDAFIGEMYGDPVVFLNTGTASSPAFASPMTNPYGLGNAGYFASPSLVDIDGDGDLDAFMGNFYGNTRFYLNTGTASAPAFAAAVTNPYGLGDVGYSANPSFVDIDGDGDLDALIGDTYGDTQVYLNTGTASSPAFATATTNPYGLGNVGASASPSFVDIDGDGDLDALIGNRAGNTLVFINTANPVAPVSSTTANGTHRVGSVIAITIVFDENVIVNTSGGRPTLALETGATDRVATYASGSGTSTLTFLYTVKAGDSSADLDYKSTSALALNGGTIQDAAGNNAILTLAAPGAAGSLASHAALVIDGVNDILNGTAGADKLNGGVGADTMTGGQGNDLYYVDNAGDKVVETGASALGGVDTVYSYLTAYTLASNVERGVIKTSGAANLTGNELVNKLYGSSGDNELYGLDGNDYLSGGAGSDTLAGGLGGDKLAGGLGEDIFVIESGSGRDVITDFEFGGNDKISLQYDLNGSGIIDGDTALAHTRDIGGRAVLDTGGGNLLILTGVLTADLTAADFMVF